MNTHFSNRTGTQGFALFRAFVEVFIGHATWLESKALHKMALLDDAAIAINMPIKAEGLPW